MLEGKAYVRAAKRVRDYAEEFFQATGQTAFPTFKQVSEKLHIPMKQIKEFTDEGIFGLMATAFNTIIPEPLGQHFVEVCE